MAVLVLAALISDIRHYKIKNRLTFSFMLIGLATNLILEGISGLIKSLLGIAVPFLLLFVLYALRMLGAGDIKLFSAIGAVLGFKAALWIMAYSFLAGGVIALIIVIVNRNGKERLFNIFNYLKNVFLTFNIQPYTNFEDKGSKAVFRMAYAISCGVIIFFVEVMLGMK
ncbi:MAG TPA: prepilin peptidase [Acetivibrio sp.]|uniref:A24 family peptidase n=1 Tax=Acetivibrio sp. TaxID=1872092 RepID=UPI002BB36665|nr:prepilin peptidase [Acetivibrio sp.]HOM01727.1 prepilin peptidase [Acetivibrio sp.]